MSIENHRTDDAGFGAGPYKISEEYQNDPAEPKKYLALRVFTQLDYKYIEIVLHNGRYIL